MKYGYYPGCSLKVTAFEYDKSLVKVFNHLGAELVEAPDWICCGASAAHATSEGAGIALPLKILSQYEQAGLKDIVVPCAACFSRFKTAVHDVENDPEKKELYNGLIGTPYNNSVAIKHPIEVLLDDFKKKGLQEKVTKKLDSLKLVCFYGCLLVRPPKIMKFDQHEYPMLMDKLVDTTGAKSLDWCYKTDCCGVSLSLSRTDIVLKLTDRIVAEAIKVGADAIIVACPLCHSNLDSRQKDIEKEFNKKQAIPILYFSQLLGLAYGMSPKELGIPSHITDAMSLLKEKKII
ncbi:CoB--CoM heterodisulfide reductase iron-sulfur subunit B family protein [Thermodesulfobacteriota bacterium]